MPAVTVGWLLLSALIAAIYLLVWLLSSCVNVGARKKTQTTKPSKPRSPSSAPCCGPSWAQSLRKPCLAQQACLERQIT